MYGRYTLIEIEIVPGTAPLTFKRLSKFGWVSWNVLTALRDGDISRRWQTCNVDATAMLCLLVLNIEVVMCFLYSKDPGTELYQVPRIERSSAQLAAHSHPCFTLQSESILPLTISTDTIQRATVA